MHHKTKKQTRAGKTSARTVKRKTYSYLIKTDYYDMAMIAREFRKRGNWEPYNNAKQHTNPDFFYMDGLHIADRKLYHIRAALKSLVGDGKKTVVIKDNLYHSLSRFSAAREFLPWTLELDIKGKTTAYLLGFQKYFSKGKPMICKIVNMGEGQNIITTDNFDVWRNFMTKKILSHTKNPKSETNKWVLQEYIANPLLKNGHKFHLRLMLLYQPDTHRHSYYIRTARAALAEAPYKRGDWTNKDIHDTHFHRKEGLLFPQDFPEITPQQLNSIYRQIDTITKTIVQAIEPGCYPDSRHCFEFFGVDLMITDNFEVKLIEVNTKIGISGSPKYKEMTFAGLLKLVVDTYFPPANPQPEISTDHFIRVPT